MKGSDERGNNQAGKAHHAASPSNLDAVAFGSVEGIYRWRKHAHPLRIDTKPAAASMNHRTKLLDVRDVSAYHLNLFLTGSVIGLIIGLGWLVSH